MERQAREHRRPRAGAPTSLGGEGIDAVAIDGDERELGSDEEGRGQDEGGDGAEAERSVQRGFLLPGARDERNREARLPVTRTDSFRRSRRIFLLPSCTEPVEPTYSPGHLVTPVTSISCGATARLSPRTTHQGDTWSNDVPEVRRRRSLD